MRYRRVHRASGPRGAEPSRTATWWGQMTRVFHICRSSDWQSAADSTWDPFADERRFLRAPLHELVAHELGTLTGDAVGLS